MNDRLHALRIVGIPALLAALVLVIELAKGAG
jgi:hypothetical protein